MTKRKKDFNIDEAIDMYNKIPQGEENAIKRKELSQSLNIENRTARDYRHWLRENDCLVMNSDKGIFRANTDKDKAIREIERYIKHNQSYIVNTQANITAAKKELNKLYSLNQEVL